MFSFPYFGYLLNANQKKSYYLKSAQNCKYSIVIYITELMNEFVVCILYSVGRLYFIYSTTKINKNLA